MGRIISVFSELAAKGKIYELKNIFVRFIFLIILVLLPFSVVAAHFSNELTTLLFQRGEFDAEDVNIVAKVQFYYLLNLPFYATYVLSLKIANSYQFHNAVLIWNSMLLFINIIMNIIFIKIFGVVGIAAATLLTFVLMTSFCVAVIYFDRFSFSQLKKQNL